MNGGCDPPGMRIVASMETTTDGEHMRKQNLKPGASGEMQRPMQTPAIVMHRIAMVNRFSDSFVHRFGLTSVLSCAGKTLLFRCCSLQTLPRQEIAQATEWHKVTAAHAPSARHQHTAVLDSQQRMWIFGGSEYPTVSGSDLCVQKPTHPDSCCCFCHLCCLFSR